MDVSFYGKLHKSYGEAVDGDCWCLGACMCHFLANYTNHACANHLLPAIPWARVSWGLELGKLVVGLCSCLSQVGSGPLVLLRGFLGMGLGPHDCLSTFSNLHFSGSVPTEMQAKPQMTLPYIACMAAATCN